MKAVICSKWGSPDVLEYTEVEKPTPKDNEVIIKIHGATVTKYD
jgi:NADPH:quinone reductase-like Zn-dependent oxidoreductase